MIYLPELGANLAGQERLAGQGEEGGAVPLKGVGVGPVGVRDECVSAINSVRSNNTTNSFMRGAFAENQTIQQLRVDNAR